MNKQPIKQEVTKTIKGKIFTGVVASAKTPKTIVVTISSMFKHPLYKKAVRRTKRVLVHNETVTVTEGDTIRIQETKPISKMKHFIALEKVR